jgi:ERCC4-related helicase
LRTLLEEAGSSAEAVLDTARVLEREKRLRPAAIAPVLEAARAATQVRARKLGKLLELVKALDSFSPGSKAVVFTRFRATLQSLSAALDAEGIPHASFHGGREGMPLTVKQQTALAALFEGMARMLSGASTPT